MSSSYDPQSVPPSWVLRWRFWIGLVLVLGLVWLLGYRLQSNIYDPKALPRAVTARGDLAADEQATIVLFRQASPSVVYITSLALQRDIFSLNMFEIPQGTGSGFIWDQKGHIINPSCAL